MNHEFLKDLEDGIVFRNWYYKIHLTRLKNH
jgi:hypothetical protein